ncbi:MAG: carbohydrate kinase family protein [Candidatus Hadarchaeales archaeon]
MELEFLVVGHVAIDVNVFPWGVVENVLGGAPTYSGFFLAGLGKRVGILSKVGIDFTELFPPIFGKFGLDTEGLIVAGERSTTFQNTYDEHGNRVQVCKHLAPPLTVGDIPSYYTGFEGVYISPLGQEVSPELLAELRKRARVLMMDPQGLFRRIGADGRVRLESFDRLADYLKYVDIAKVGKDELAAFPGKSPAQVAEELRAAGASVAVVTQGEGGCIVSDGKEIRKFPALQVEVRDHTGAGDVFGAAFLCRYVETHDVVQSAKFANAAAGLKIRYRGAVGFPSLEEILRAIR